MKNIRVAILRTGFTKKDEILEDFVEIAKKSGKTMTLDEFTEAVNNDKISLYGSTLIRFFECEENTQ